MKTLKKPCKLNRGDKIALVSLSWGGAGDADILWRYNQGKERLQQVFGLEVIEMKHTLAGTEFIYNHPEKRAEDLMNAFQDNSIKGIIACIGGIESIRMLPYIDFNIISNNPKIFMGYSDSTTTHLFCYKAGISSIYGPTLLVDFAENVSMNQYTIEYLEKTLFSSEAIGKIEPTLEWTSEYLPWEEKNKLIQRKYKTNHGYELLQGKGIVQGHLIGGCFEVLDMLRGTEVFPKLEDFDDSILFLETSEEKPPAWYIECGLRNYGINGILDRIKGIVWGKPQDEEYYEEYKMAIKKVMKEFHKEDLSILYNMNFGHTEPKICLPYGALAEIDCNNVSFSILEAAVI
ncbi:microcin C7 self-immunity protein MccF [Clostridium homopropionicum DSM 5847]|uniref:Microcin C7 self-immunity protein MccF n=1 Tax=Clostridium homopropionicum DSM 5847 TaxID=1121318 RepID=A0A0L6Z8A7_9CLOT|nr:S66 peptidase family protein [Clostridium homopropionicum]KOA19197.1 microcin C7 self-immunity protein MccF [Clostridium homopropionicum DSM 5847]SFG17129.1 Muramoyltetrapeptide carboxypeptidase LdcA (peptidoglycan recycling) [Clostridium homopropionicum]